MTSTPYAPDTWLGTRLARELLDTDDPHRALATAQHHGEKRLRTLVGLLASMIVEVDTLDEDAEKTRRTLADRVNGGRRYTDGPYNDADSACDYARRLEKACTSREHSTVFLRRLLLAYRAAANTDTP